MKKCNSIILIDDSPMDNLVNSQLVNELDITDNLVVLVSGQEGIEYLTELTKTGPPPSLIFLDLHMPKMNGFDFMEKLNVFPNAFRQEIKIIVLTSSLEETDFEDSKNLGCDGYLIKPLTSDMVMDEFEKVFYYD